MESKRESSNFQSVCWGEVTRKQAPGGGRAWHLELPVEIKGMKKRGATLEPLEAEAEHWQRWKLFPGK